MDLKNSILFPRMRSYVLVFMEKHYCSDFHDGIYDYEPLFIMPLFILENN